MGGDGGPASPSFSDSFSLDIIYLMTVSVLCRK